VTAQLHVELGVRAPRPTAGLPTSAQYLVGNPPNGSRLSTGILASVSTGGDEAVDFDVPWRMEFDLALGDGDSWRIVDVTDDLTTASAFRVTVNASPARSVVVRVADLAGRNAETHTFYNTTIARLAGTGARFRMAVEFDSDQSVIVEYAEVNDDVSTGLSAATWTTVGSASTTIGRIAESVVSFTQPASTNDQHVFADDAALAVSGSFDVVALFKLTHQSSGRQDIASNWRFGVTKSWYATINNGVPELWTSGTGGGDSFMAATAALSTAGYSTGDWLYGKWAYDTGTTTYQFSYSDDGVNWTALGSGVSGNQTAINTTSQRVYMFQDIGSGLSSEVAFIAFYDGSGALLGRCDASDSTNATASFTGDLDGLTWDPNGASLTRTEYGRTFTVHSGGSTDGELRLIEMRIVDSGTERAAITSASITSSAIGSTYTEDSLAWSIDSNAELYAEGDWEDLLGDGRADGGLRVRRGRSQDQGIQQTGEMQFLLDNRTREYEPGYAASAKYPAIAPLTPVRVRGTYSATDYDVFTGFARRFLPQFMAARPDDSVAQLDSVDAFRLFNTFKTGGSLGAVLTGLSPVAMWPMTDTGSTFDDTIGTNHLTITGVTKGSESPFFGGKNRVGYWDGTADATDSAADSVVEITGDCSLAFVINTTVGGDYHICSVYGTNGCYFGVELDIAESQQPIVRWIRNDGTPTSAGNDVTLDLDYGACLDGKPHIFVVTYDQSADTLVVYMDGDNVGSSTDAVPAGNGTPVVAGTPTIKVGEEGTHGSGTSNYVGLLGYLAVFNSVLTHGDAHQIGRCRIDGFRSQTPAARINALLDAYGWPSTWRDLDTSSSVQPSAAETIFDGVESAWKNADANIDVVIPATAQVGGYAYAAIAWPSNRTITTVPTGWSAITNGSAQSGSTFQHVEMNVYRKLIASGDPGSTHTFVRSNSAGGHAWICVATSEVDTSTQESDSQNNTGASSTSVTAPTVTAADGDLLITFHSTFSITTTLTSFSSGPSGMTLLAEENATNKASAQRSNMGAWYQTNVSAGATGTKTATRSAAEPFACVSVAVNAGTPSTTSGALAEKDMADASLYSELTDVVDAEGGELFIAADGKVVYRSRTWRTTNSTAVTDTFGTAASGEQKYDDVTYRYDEQDMVNEVSITDADGNEATIHDEVSIARYGKRDYSATVDLTGGSAAQDRAQVIIDRYGSPRLQIDTLAVSADADEANLYPLLFGMDFGERYRLRHRPPSWTTSQPQLDRQFYPEAWEIAVRAAATNPTWRWAITASEAPTIQVQILDLLGADLLAYWPLDDTSGRSRDLSGLDNDMDSATGAITREATGPFAGELATSGFGIGTYEQWNDTASDNWEVAQAWTIGAWVKITAFDVGTAFYADILLLSKEVWGTSGARLWFYPSTGVNLDTIALSDSNNQTSTIHQPNGSNVSIADSVWRHLAATYDGSGTLTLYVDGVATGTLSETVVEPSANAFLGGGWPGPNADGTGAFTAAHVFIADRALTATEVSKLASYAPY
jgi:hypothetical protein